ncbi:alpha/beta hydrolase [Parvularcula sp. LCG005]|uniref:alpha/beta fold hydrolase n=1 Tax=Parvularcula sp. LCG005 TaxID=3078805 RepID=UPI002942F515|nr:alpha/beta hydrolase [Parvularcula sp. LCG005]WOI52013.1 alpha/beta hydrolase [Parvularcula sp. LCG005]
MPIRLSVRRLFARLTATVMLVSTSALADPLLADFDYGEPVQHFSLVSQGQALDMAYLDLAPRGQLQGTVVLLHGKNFCAATWRDTTEALRKAGYRVIAPDQIGFCKSSKPPGYQYGLHTLAANTNALLNALEIERPIIMGHSMGGMLAARYALQYPDSTGALVMVNPIGLEDWRAKGVPNATVDNLYAAQKKTTRDSIKAYQQSTYYVGTWQPGYDEWVDMLWSMYQGAGGDIVAWHQALTADMIFNQPVVHEFPSLRVPTLLLIGEQDNTALGKARAPASLRDRLGNYSVLATETEAAIPDARLITFKDLGHSPHIEAADRFHKALLPALKSLKTSP